jgi:aldehyde dehydrogenase (NAD+)
MVFDGEAAAVVKEMRLSFNSGKTRSYEWRISQVKAFLKMVVEQEDQIIEALRSDLAKPPLETVVYEVLIIDSFLIYKCSLHAYVTFISC